MKLIVFELEELVERASWYGDLHDGTDAVSNLLVRLFGYRVDVESIWIATANHCDTTCAH